MNEDFILITGNPSQKKAMEQDVGWLSGFGVRAIYAPIGDLQYLCSEISQCRRVLVFRFEKKKNNPCIAKASEFAASMGKEVLEVVTDTAGSSGKIQAIIRSQSENTYHNLLLRAVPESCFTQFGLNKKQQMENEISERQRQYMQEERRQNMPGYNREELQRTQVRLDRKVLKEVRKDHRKVVNAYYKGKAIHIGKSLVRSLVPALTFFSVIVYFSPLRWIITEKMLPDSSIPVICAEEDLLWSVEEGSAVVNTYTGAGGWIELPAELGDYPVSELGGESFQKRVTLKGLLLRHQLRGIVLPEGLSSIGVSAFGEQTALEYVAFPSTLTHIGSEAFANCRRLKEINLPEGLTQIGGQAFADTAVKHLELPETLALLKGGTFRSCGALEYVSIPGAVVEIGKGCFEDCTALSDLRLGEGIKQINASAFKRCSSLTGLVLPQSLETIEESAFAECDNLTEVYIGGGVNSIAPSAFASHNKYLTIYGPSGSYAEQWSRDNGIKFVCTES